MSKTSSYHDALIQSLTDPTEAKHYLKAVLEDYPEGFLKALRNVAQANRMSKVAEEAGVQRETLYRSLSSRGNPTLGTLSAVLNVVGLRLSVEELAARPEPARRAPSRGEPAAAREDRTPAEHRRTPAKDAPAAKSKISR